LIEFLRQFANAGVSNDLAEEVSCIVAAGGERTPEQVDLVQQAWNQVQQSDKRLADRIETIMTAE
jgi:hypothetical protein